MGESESYSRAHILGLLFSKLKYTVGIKRKTGIDSGGPRGSDSERKRYKQQSVNVYIFFFKYFNIRWENLTIIQSLKLYFLASPSFMSSDN